ncbi:MAG: DUF3788 domain-containing protein [Candidatus Cloacimonetes bacterium]|nr:DUF3788 domain-containing protein [Candidatus Cloacimonadota bacterium]MCF7813609.1 DUF3788 domain-containing protein [Candidatus Cloacimonadota bacterium]MCF7867925.1 DUF3788 domain-containing protein [Candidatus Cloacimonadota bacterium]MCF7882882.1 DUF3788 domain-containing protein [Candidatus Cloacimonadota bacterium]
MNNDQIQLTDPEIYPDEKILENVLGNSYAIFTKLLKLYKENDMMHEWRYYNDGKAWLCKVQKKKRTIVWMSAWPGYMNAAIYIPKRLIDNVYALDIADEIKQKIESTKDVGKSKPCIFEIRDESILEDFEKVMQLKIKSK